eukprot:1114757-Pelagomonas_calceolata.AAC.4
MPCIEEGLPDKNLEPSRVLNAVVQLLACTKACKIAHWNRAGRFAATKGGRLLMRCDFGSGQEVPRPYCKCAGRSSGAKEADT